VLVEERIVDLGSLALYPSGKVIQKLSRVLHDESYDARLQT